MSVLRLITAVSSTSSESNQIVSSDFNPQINVGDAAISSVPQFGPFLLGRYLCSSQPVTAIQNPLANPVVDRVV